MKKLAWRLRFTRIMMQQTNCGIAYAWKASEDGAVMFGLELWRDVQPAFAATVESNIYVSNQRKN